MEKHLADLESLIHEAQAFARTLTPTASATLVTLSGELGAGKTSFTQGVAQALGITEPVTSPTFVLERVYELTGQSFERLVHIDAYRLESGRALGALGFDELMQDAQNLVLLEWPERVQDALPPATHSLTLTVAPEGGRILRYG